MGNGVRKASEIWEASKAGLVPVETWQGRMEGGNRGHVAVSLRLVVRANDCCDAATCVTSGPGPKHLGAGVRNIEQSLIELL